MATRRRRALAHRHTPIAYEPPPGGVMAWAGEHPFLTFFLVSSAIGGIVTIVRGFPKPPVTVVNPPPPSPPTTGG